MAIPTVSIGLPVYNGEKYLRNALESLLQQDYEDFEIIVSDNASTDLTPQICREFSTRDSRIRYYQNESNLGAKWNYRRVFELARGKYFKWVTHDDECYPSMLRRCFETLDQAPSSVVLVCPQAEIIDEYGHVVGSPEDHVASNAANPHQRLACVLFNAGLAPSFYGLIRTETLRKTRGYIHIAADWVLLAELSLWGEILEIPEVLFRMRRHKECAMHVNKTRRSMEAWYDPARGNRRLILPYQFAVMIEYMKSVQHTLLPPADKALCFMMVILVPNWSLLLRNTGKQRNWLRNILKLRK